MKFTTFNKIPRLSRDIVITEKIDGSNGQIAIFSSDTLFSWFEEIIEPYDDACHDFIEKYCLFVHPDNPHVDPKDYVYVFAGSRKRWLDTSSNGDKFGFAKWVQENACELVLKLGEGLHFGEWWGKGIQRGYGVEDKRFSLFNVGKWSDPEARPKCCGVVPVLFEGDFDTQKIETVVEDLRVNGSRCAPGFKDPEGIIVFHTASRQLFKKTCVNDEKPKGQDNG